MANARSHFDMIVGYLERTHEAQPGLLYGKPCVNLNGQPFAAYQLDGMAFRLHGRSLTQILTLPGARGWDPLRPDGVAPGWVLVPTSQVLRWDRLALEALRCAREASERRVSYASAPAPDASPAEAAVQPEAASQEAAPSEPPPSNPASLAQRVSAAIASGFRSLTLSNPD